MVYVKTMETALPNGFCSLIVFLKQKNKIILIVEAPGFATYVEGKKFSIKFLI